MNGDICFVIEEVTNSKKRGAYYRASLANNQTEWCYGETAYEAIAELCQQLHEASLKEADED
jgi:hypothetical protein